LNKTQTKRKDLSISMILTTENIIQPLTLKSKQFKITI